jgi:hypothetical protein
MELERAGPGWRQTQKCSINGLCQKVALAGAVVSPQTLSMALIRAKPTLSGLSESLCDGRNGAVGPSSLCSQRLLDRVQNPIAL